MRPSNISLLEHGSSKNPNKIILLHGYGASASDLFPIAQRIDPDGNLGHWLFPEGVYEVRGDSRVLGRAWFPMDWEIFERARATNDYALLTESVKEDYWVGFSALKDFLEEFQKIHLGGFSQGAMLALQLAMVLTKKVRSLAIMSGVHIAHQEWEAGIKNAKSLEFFQSHGKGDNLLPYQGAKKLFQLMQESGHKGEFYSFLGGHEIPDSILSKYKNFLSNKTA